MPLQDRTAVVTGASGNLGPAVVGRLLKGGARVAAVAHGDAGMDTLAGLAEEQSGRLLALRADVTDPDQVERLRAQVSNWCGHPGILLNLAGGYQGSKNLWELSPDDWDQMMRINLRSAFLCCRAFVPGMLSAGWGRVINISSRAATSLRTGQGAYAVSKAGLITFTETLREELRGTGVCAFAIAPSVIDSEEARRSMPKAAPTRWVTPDEIARGIVLLCSEDADLFSGSVLSAYGGV